MTDDPRKHPAYVALFRAEQAMATARTVIQMSGVDETIVHALVAEDRARGLSPVTSGSHSEVVEQMSQELLLALAYWHAESLSRQIYACLVAAQKLVIAGLDLPPRAAVGYLLSALQKLRSDELSQN